MPACQDALGQLAAECARDWHQTTCPDGGEQGAEQLKHSTEGPGIQFPLGEG